jgi:regulator of protease activity HflC (stomatin/prohibitin superfamily)
MAAETEARTRSGWVMLPWLIGAFIGIGAVFGLLVRQEQDAHGSQAAVIGWGIALTVLGEIVVLVLARGLFALNPNASAVITLFGDYQGTVRRPGFYWMNPFCVRRGISLRVRNLNTPTLKVNDLKGNPIEIAAVVVWRVGDTFRAVFEVDDYQNFVTIQSEAALRHLCSAYPYDSTAEHETSLRGSMDEVSKRLRSEVEERLSRAGVVVEEARLSHLAYAPEIAGAMLRRQQAEAIVSARFRIVEGAVGMVEAALEHLEKSKTVTLDPERKAAMVSNLMVVLCGDHSVQPVINTGTLYT